MRLVLMVMYVFFISATGLTAHSSVSDDIFCDDINIRHDWDHPDNFHYECRNMQNTAINSQLFMANDYLFDNCLFDTHQISNFITYDDGETKRIDNFNDKLTKNEGSDYLVMYTGNELSNIDRNGDHALADKPRSGNKSDCKVVSWLKNTYQLWAAKDHYGSIRLLLLSFGLVGIIGIRRKFTKH